MHQTVSEQTEEVKMQFIIHQGLHHHHCFFVSPRCLYILCNLCTIANATDINSNIFQRYQCFLIAESLLLSSNWGRKHILTTLQIPEGNSLIHVRFILTLSLIKMNTRIARSPWSQGTQHDPFLPLYPPVTHWWLAVLFLHTLIYLFWMVVNGENAFLGPAGVFTASSSRG